MDAVTPTTRTQPLSRLRWLAIASMVANAALIITGGLVRLTKSGLGCPTWPKCAESYLPDEALGIHGIIEFGNRMLTFVLVALALATWLVARRVAHPQRELMSRIAFGVGLGIIAQALIGGVTVLTKVNPWVVGLHLVVSLVLVGLCAWLVHLSGPHTVEADLPLWGRRAGIAAVAVGFVAMCMGTIVTGAGPNSGDDAARRNGIELMVAAKAHAWAIWVFVALTIAAVVLLRRHRAGKFALALLVVELLQGFNGYWQYFHDLDWQMVLFHMVGVAVTSIATGLFLCQVWPGADGKPTAQP